jgi:ABC-type lipoprotein release transport system permease subunit
MSSTAELKRIALRSLARHKVKSALTILAVSISVCLYIFADGWLTGMNIDSVRNIANFETGAAKLQTRAYHERKDELPMYESFGQWEQWAAALDRAGYDSAPRFVFSGTIYSESASAPMEFIACDPPSEARVLHYPEYMESGRYIKNRAFEIVLGAITAEKLKTGIPQRPNGSELEELLASLPPESEAFVRSLYEKGTPAKQGLFAPKEPTLPPDSSAASPPASSGEERWTLKRNISAPDLDRYWELLARAGRMNIRISTVIDIKAAPESIRKEKYELDLAPLLSGPEQELFLRAYEFDEAARAWYLVSGDRELQEQILSAMIRVDYPGAIQHVNQLISAVVVGIVNSPNPKNNNNTAWIPLDVLQDETGLMLEGRITELLIRIKNPDDSRPPGRTETPAAIRSGLSKTGAESGPELDIYPWQDYVQDYLGAAAQDNITTRIMTAILFLLSFLGIANTMLLAILERTREIGMMRAMGMSDGQLIFAYMLEAGITGFFGSALGVIAGCLINIPMVTYGLDFTAMTESMGGDIGYRVTGIFRSVWNIPVIAGSGVIATILAACTAFFPVRRALKMPVTESLRFG